MSNIRGLRDLSNDDDHHHGDSGAESDGEQQSFFVGGSETSGQQVLGPPSRAGRDNANIRDQLFEDARRNGAEGMAPEELNEQNNSRFPGGGVRLDSAAPVPAEAAQQPRGPTDVIVTLNMYDSGFSFNDGPLRLFSDAANQPTLRALSAGQIPPEVLTMHPGRSIDLRMVNKGKYEPPKAKPFNGSGVRLGAVVPEIVGGSSSAAPAAVAAPVDTAQSQGSVCILTLLSILSRFFVPDNAASLLDAAQAAVGLDSNSPVTQVQIRLNNGQRLVGKFNHTHTVSTVRNFIVTAQPDLAFAPFQLMTTFPNKVVDDETQSLKDASLLNAVVVVKPSAA